MTEECFSYKSELRNTSSMWFTVLVAVAVKITAFWDMRLGNL
jgi:hypothetical protein